MINSTFLKSIGCLAYYPLNQTAKDISSNGNHATAADSVMQLGNQTGMDHIVIISDVDSKLTLPASILAPTTGSFSAWIKCNTTADIHILSKCRTTANRIFEIGYWYTGGRMRLCVTVNNSGSPNHSVYVEIKDPFNWHHIAVTADGSIWKLYLNGNPQTITISTGSNSGKWGGALTAHDYYAIGTRSYNNIGEEYSAFQIREVFIGDTALPQATINNLMMSTIIY